MFCAVLAIIKIGLSMCRIRPLPKIAGHPHAAL